ncbi:MAG: class I SAM-dependent methyltransferase [Desulfovibrionaceae bacterium]|nr:class I SAM-dependent methyltransferase [Desulfovibrionaceae bacterium]
MSENMAKQFPMSWEQAVEWLREQPGQEALVKACFFDDPLLEAAKRFHQSEEWAQTRKRLPDPSGKALDLGAGRGISSYALAKDGFAVTALEPDPSSLVGAGAIRSLAEESGLPITVVQEWGEQLPFPDHSFDLAHGRQVLHHARDLPGLCCEVARVLKPGGVFIATREHVVDRPEELPVFLAGHPLHHLYGGENAFSLPQYVAAIEEAGFWFSEILAPFDSAINYYPATLEQVNALAKQLCPSAPDKIAALRRTCRTPGRLFTFVTEKYPCPPDSGQDATCLRQALQSAKVIRQALTDTLCAFAANPPAPSAASPVRGIAHRYGKKVLYYLRRLCGRQS